jgi:hypothetical protein
MAPPPMDIPPPTCYSASEWMFVASISHRGLISTHAGTTQHAAHHGRRR